MAGPPSQQPPNKHIIDHLPVAATGFNQGATRPPKPKVTRKQNNSTSPSIPIVENNFDQVSRQATPQTSIIAAAATTTNTGGNSNYFKQHHHHKNVTADNSLSMQPSKMNSQSNMMTKQMYEHR